MDVLLVHLLNSLLYASVLFLIAGGLSLIYGVMRIVNLAHGNIYAPEKVDAALSRYFRVGNLSALRELALLWLADRVDEGLERYRNKEGIAASWPARERVVVALTGGLESEVLLRRAARITSRGAGGELHAVYVVRSDGLVAAGPRLG